MNMPNVVLPLEFQWPDDVAKVPYWVYSSPEVYALEQERIFRGPTWNFVALDAELAKPFDWKSTYIGDTPVIVTRDGDGNVHAWVNRCAHRGALICRELRGNNETHTCVYHQWAYDSAGNLIGVPFRRGIAGKGGYPEDFKMSEHNAQKLRIAQHKSLIFATFSDDAPSLEEYLGQEMIRWIDRVFIEPVEFLGTARQFISSNWKLYTENTKDPYHASLLHLFHATFGVYRSSMGGGATIGGMHGLHSCLNAWKIEMKILESTKLARSALTMKALSYPIQACWMWCLSLTLFAPIISNRFFRAWCCNKFIIHWLSGRFSRKDPINLNWCFTSLAMLATPPNCGRCVLSKPILSVRQDSFPWKMERLQS